MARVSSFWKKIGDTIEPVFAGGVNILLRGTNRYINFGSVDEVDGYGFRDNNGTIEYKSSGGSWAAVGSGGGGGGISDGDKGDITVSASGTVWTIDAGVVTLAKTSAGVQASLALADSATQPGDNISTLVNDAGYITEQSAAEVPFTPAGDILATDVQAALEELDAEKLGVDALSANLILYPTTTASDIGGYSKLASNIADPDYDATAANVSTGAITTTSQLISSLASEAGIIEGELGVLNNTVIGNIRRTAGSGTATFYFEVYKRSSGGTETLLETSANTLPVSSGTYVQFSASGLINNGPFLLTDRIVLKFYGNRIAGGSDPTYDFQFGGNIPTRALFPLPLTAVPTDAHNELSGLQGGTTDEYYHLTEEEDTFLNDITATAAEVNILDGVTATTAELNFVDGVTSNMQTQLNAKAPTASPTFTGTTTTDALVYDTAAGTVSALGNLGATELVDWSTASHFTGTLDQACSITHSNETAGQKITMAFTGEFLPTFSDIDQWGGGTAPTAPGAGETLLVTVIRLGATVYGSYELFS